MCVIVIMNYIHTHHRPRSSYSCNSNIDRQNGRGSKNSHHNHNHLILHASHHPRNGTLHNRGDSKRGAQLQESPDEEQVLEQEKRQKKTPAEEQVLEYEQKQT